MSARLQALFHLFQARLSQRIVLWVFASIVMIEGIILIPSVYRRQQELLQHLQDVSSAQASGILGLGQIIGNDAELVNHLEWMTANSIILGGALYRADGQLIGTFGQLPALTLDAVQVDPRATIHTDGGRYYDAAWWMSQLSDRYVLIIRHDSSGVRHELYAFIGRIAGLVVIISIFVTVATMIVLEPTLITPILWLRSDLLKVGESVDQDAAAPKFYSTQIKRRDELGEVLTAFEQMHLQITQAIAQRKQAEAALRLSEEKFSKAFQGSPDPIILTTVSDGRLVEVNDSFLRGFRCQYEDVIGKTIFELGLWVDSDARSRIIQRLRAGETYRNQEHLFRNRAGDLRTVLYSAELIRLEGTEYLLSVANDITERKQMEEALRQSEERFRMLVEQAADAFFVVNEAGQFVEVNQQACENLGYTHAELLTLSVPDVQQHLSLEAFQQLWHSLTPGESVTLEGRHRRKDGIMFPVEVRVGLFQAGGQQFVLALSRDVTERKEAEKAVSRLAEIGELAAMIVHEVRNPLTTVLMGLRSFESMELPARAQSRLALALDEADRLQRLLNEILLYTKHQVLQAEALNISEFIYDILDSICAMPAAEGRRVEFMPTAEPLLVWADKDKLRQVFINLVANACEALAVGETVTWRSQLEANSQQVRIQIHNGGEPIAADVLPHLTKPFYTTKTSGNGLGLAIVKRIVEAHGGDLTIASIIEQGTTVTIRLPVYQSSHGASVADS